MADTAGNATNNDTTGTADAPAPAAAPAAATKGEKDFTLKHIKKGNAYLKSTQICCERSFEIRHEMCLHMVAHSQGGLFVHPKTRDGARKLKKHQDRTDGMSLEKIYADIAKKLTKVFVTEKSFISSITPTMVADHLKCDMGYFNPQQPNTHSPPRDKESNQKKRDKNFCGP